MEKISDLSLSVTIDNVIKNPTNNEKDMQEVDEEDFHREKHKDIFGDNKCNNLNEVNDVLINQIYCKDLIDKDVINTKEDKIVNAENDQDSGVFDDVHRKESELLSEDSNSLKEQNESASIEDFFPISDKDAINGTVEEDPVIDKGILEDNDSEDYLSDKEGIRSDFALSEPPSPLKDKDESDLEHEDQERREIRPTRNDLSLPYFQLPKPDLDEFLIETEKNLEISVIPCENQLSQRSSVPKPKPRKDIVFFKPPPDVKGNFFDPKKVFITFDLSSDSAPCKISNALQSKPKISSASPNNEYGKVLSTLDTEEKTPGVKRLALKEFLKKQIDQKKFEAFNQSKMLNIMDEEMEEPIENEYPETDDEDSSEEHEEATVSFDTKEQNSGDENSLNEAPKELQLNDENSDEDSDDDFIGVKKTKKKFLVLDEDSDNEDFMTEKKEDSDLLDLENSSSSLPALDEIVKTKLHGQSDDKSVLNNVEMSNRDLERNKNKESGFGAEIAQTRISNSIFSQISSSMPSFQPGGGFLNQDNRQEDSSDSIFSTSSQQNVPSKNEGDDSLCMRLQPEQSILRSLKNPILENDAVVENVPSPHSDDRNTFGIKLSDLPVSQSVNDSNIFLTEELADVCSGAFDKEASDITPEETPKHAFLEKMKDFFDDEAELSGEDDGIDDKDEDEYEEDIGILASDEENLPEAEVLREEIADLHMKRLMNEDEEHIKAIQEQFLDDGELDGAGRSRRFAWLNNDMDIAPSADNSDSDSDADAIDDSLVLNQEKAKWLHENKEEESKNENISEELNSSGSRRKSFLKVDIIGKPKFSQEENSRRLSFKRPRGSYLNLDNSSACQVLKKLKASEDNLGGSRTTKHFVFRNDSPEVSSCTKNSNIKSVKRNSSNNDGSPILKSVFSKI